MSFQFLGSGFIAGVSKPRFVVLSLGTFFDVRYKGFYAQLNDFCNILTDLGWSWQRKADSIPRKTRIKFSDLVPISIIMVPDGTWGKALVFCSRMDGTRNSN